MYVPDDRFPLNTAAGYSSLWVTLVCPLVAMPGNLYCMMPLFLVCASRPQALHLQLFFLLWAFCYGICAALMGVVVGIPALRLRGDFWPEIIRVVLVNTLVSLPVAHQGLTGILLTGYPEHRNCCFACYFCYSYYEV